MVEKGVGVVARVLGVLSLGAWAGFMVVRKS